MWRAFAALLVRRGILGTLLVKNFPAPWSSTRASDRLQKVDSEPGGAEGTARLGRQSLVDWAVSITTVGQAVLYLGHLGTPNRLVLPSRSCVFAYGQAFGPDVPKSWDLRVFDDMSWKLKMVEMLC
ncbi:hypothetical protein CCHR01_03809 [Colletotrichum chrysophilum]|uniref:Uncharacterized protein n=1 Tax=Colletotrichum chrysophilum TaxID=1836956 RepID=A0AAD9AVS4_9PEZI|nr:hypothetical protein CCHR01_03809 [Colletotrichum chrysophilum]